MADWRSRAAGGAVRGGVVVCLALAFAGAAVPAGAASPYDPVAYRNAVERADQALHAGPPTPATAAVAAAALETGTGESQPEVLDDLRATPPRVADAERRLEALDVALRSPMGTQDRAGADASLRSILGQARYAVSGPSLFDQAVEALLRALARALGSAGGSPVAALVEIGVAALAAAVVIGLLVRLLLSRRSAAEVAAAAADAPRRAAHSFAEADRLSAAGDYAGALRALTSAVATTLGGAGTWETSPETVRELFAREHVLAELRPLVLPFEALAYGHHPPDAATYAAADTAAAVYRAGVRPGVQAA